MCVCECMGGVQVGGPEEKPQQRAAMGTFIAANEAFFKSCKGLHMANAKKIDGMDGEKMQALWKNGKLC